MGEDRPSSYPALERAKSRHADREGRVLPSESATIFVVDDEPANLDTVSLVLQDRYAVSVFKDPQRALDTIANDGCPDLIIADQRMPGLTGTALIEKVVELHPDAVGVILSGFTDRGALVAAINRAHVFAYLTKPWRAETLLDTVRRALVTINKQRVHRQVKSALESLRSDLGELSSSVAGGPDDLNESLQEICTEMSRLASGQRRTGEQFRSREKDERG